MTYAKLKNNTLIPSPLKIHSAGQVISNPGPEQLRELGYKEVVYPQQDSADDLGEPLSEVPKAPLCAVYTEDEGHIYVNYTPSKRTPEPDSAMLREQAYRAETDQYLNAYQGYLLEGKTAEAESQKILYLECKERIRARYND